ncbi:serine hydrolase domain-containing protein [Ekhidna sp.]|uniref:serine hydrolase domain-containing protein n=1 Tax=Ekhidna sp. TaxID=2608089 RepID=UPI0032EADC47
MTKSILFLLLIASQIILKAQSDLETVRSEFKERITKTMKKSKVVGATVAVVSSEGILWIDNFGYEDAENEKPVTDETIFGIGSVTKVLTSAAVMQLAEHDKLDIDNPLSQYLPSFQMQDNSGGVTPRNVMTHHSGLPSDIFKGMFSEQPEDYKCLVNYINDEYMAGTPNQIRAYSNPGYTLLGHMISEVSGMEYPEYIKANILHPLGMNNTEFNALEKASKTYNGKGKNQSDVNLRDVPAGGLFTSTKDLSKFLEAFLSQSQDLLKPDTYQQILEQQHKGTPLDFGDRYALGWSMTSRPHAGDIYYHTGTTLYFNAAMAFSPKADVGVIILTNSARGRSVYKEVHNIIDKVAENKGLPKVENEALEELGSKERIKVSPNELDQYTGIYAAPGAYIDVYRKNKKLFMKLQGLRLELIPVENNQFIPKVILLHLIPIRLGDQRVMFEEVDGYPLMTSLEEGNPKELIAARFEKQEIPEAWKSRTGDYEIINPLPGEIPFFGDFSIAEKDDLLVFSFKTTEDGQNIEMVMDFISDDRAKVAGLGRYGGQSIIYKDGTIKAFGNELKINE